MNLLVEGLTIMAIGLGFVIVFLCVLIFSMCIMSKIVAYLNTLFPEVVEATMVKNTDKSSNDDNEAIALAIAVAKSAN